jgi:flagellar biosynthesis anti-sigma factor FlgM
MRIDLNHITLQDLARDEKSRKTGLKNPSAPNVEDKTSLSADTKGIASLQAQALATPAIRQDKVEALRQSIQQGDYKLEPDQIAHAILNQNQR